MLILYLIKLRHEVRIFLRYLLCSSFMLYSTLFHEEKIPFQAHQSKMWTYKVVREEVVEALQYNLAFLTLHHDAVQVFLDKSSDLAFSIVLTARASLELTRLCIDTNAELNYSGYDWLESVVRARPWDHYVTQDMCWEKIEEMKGPNREVITELFRLRRDAENL